MLARATDRVFDPVARKGIFGADVQVAALATGRNRGYGHRLDDGERVALHEDAVLEGPRF